MPHFASASGAQTPDPTAEDFPLGPTGGFTFSRPQTRPPFGKFMDPPLVNPSIVKILGTPMQSSIFSSSGCRRPSFSGRCCSCLEWTATRHHVCTVPSTSFLQSS